MKALLCENGQDAAYFFTPDEWAIVTEKFANLEDEALRHGPLPIPPRWKMPSVEDDATIRIEFLGCPVFVCSGEADERSAMVDLLKSGRNLMKLSGLPILDCRELTSIPGFIES